MTAPADIFEVLKEYVNDVGDIPSDALARISRRLAATPPSPPVPDAAVEALQAAHDLLTNVAFDAGPDLEWALSVDAKIVAALSQPSVPSNDGREGWHPLTCKDDKMTCAMPPDETVVEVMLQDGAICQAWYSCNIMEAGDFDFMPVDADGEPDEEAESIAAKIVAWRLALSKATGGSDNG